MTVSSIGWRCMVPVTYTTIALSAFVVDRLTDRSGGSFSLATLPIALLAAGCFVVGQVSAKGNVKRHFSNWLLGVALVLLGLVVFAMKGGDAPKDGELIFTYAMLLTAPPASFVLPLTTSIGTGHMLNDVLLRSLVGWCVCVATGAIQWSAVRWLMRKLRGRYIARSSNADNAPPATDGQA